MNIQEQKKALLQLLTSDDLAELQTMSDNKFNIFKVLKLENAEIRHSNFLGWLLTPFETHNLMDIFLKELLKIALRNDTNLVDIILNNLTDAQVTLEKMANDGRRMDIFIDCPTNKLVCVIENKVWSGEGCNQLEDYRNYILSHDKYKDYKYKIFLFLTPYKYSPCEDYKGYIRINYGDILKAIDKLMKQYGCLLDDDVKMFMEHYKRIVERNIMKKYDDDTVRLCRKIYRENKNAIDLIVSQIYSREEEIKEILTDVVLEKEDFISTGYGNREFIEFYQRNLNEKYNYNQNSGIARIYYLFYQTNKSVDFILWLNFGDNAQKKQIYDILKANEEKLQNCKLEEYLGKKIEKTIVINFINEEEYQSFEDMTCAELKVELANRFDSLYENSLKSIISLFNDNIDKLLA